MRNPDWMPCVRGYSALHDAELLMASCMEKIDLLLPLLDNSLSFNEKLLHLNEKLHDDTLVLKLIDESIYDVTLVFKLIDESIYDVTLVFKLIDESI